MLNRSTRRTVVVVLLLSFAALPVAAEPARSRPAGPIAVLSDLVTTLAEKLLGLWQKSDTPPPPPPDDRQTLDCRSTIDPWGCPKP